MSLAVARKPRFSDLSAWLAWQETLHANPIDLGLERVSAVAQVLQLQRPDCAVVSIAGTNGKGSSAAMLSAILVAGGYQVGTYTSPHINHYCERIQINTNPVSEADVCDAFQQVDEARGETSLTYFEFGTLAALAVFRRSQLDIVILEVGLGGRLDAVNVVDADVALVTSLSVDHVEWLGDDRDQIAREKAGIFRSGKTAICSDPQPPQSLIACAQEVGTELLLLGRDYHCRRTCDQWSWWREDEPPVVLQLPRLKGEFQIENAAGVIMAVQVLASDLPLETEAINHGLANVELPARFQVLPGPVPVVIDVAHNVDSARALAGNLQNSPVAGNTHAVTGMLETKDHVGIVTELLDSIQTWHLADLEVAGATPVATLQGGLMRLAPQASCVAYASIGAALAGAEASAQPGDRIVVFGSFRAVATALQAHPSAAQVPGELCRG